MIRLLSVITVVFFSSCSHTQKCNELEQKIMDICVQADSTYTISLVSLTDFEWDTLYVISGPTIDNEAGDVIEIKDYKKIIPDKSRQYVFVKDNKIVKEYTSYCNLNLSKTSSYTISHKYSNSASLKVKKIILEDQFIYNLEEIAN